MSRPSLRYLRLAVTSRCNLQCIYCRPPRGAEGDDLLTREEIARFVRLAVECGVEKVRITGGEPLVRGDILDIVRDLAATPGLADLGLTTNGTLLAPLAAPLRAAGLRRINIGLSAVTPGLYRRITRVGSIADALAGLRAALAAGFDPVKVNVVVMRGVNDAEVPALARLAQDDPIEVRFVEYMPFLDTESATSPMAPCTFLERRVKVRSESDEWKSAESLPSPVTLTGHFSLAAGRGRLVVPSDEVLARLRTLGAVEELPGKRGAAAARRYRIAGHRGSTGSPRHELVEWRGTVGIIAPHSAPFCHACNRVRLTADGRLRACLIEGGEQDALPLIRRGLDRPTMERLLAGAAALKPALHKGSFRGQMHRIGG